MKERCAECGCHIFEQKNEVYVCHQCGKPLCMAETPKDEK